LAPVLASLTSFSTFFDNCGTSADIISYMAITYTLISGDARYLYDKGAWLPHELTSLEISGLPLARKEHALGAFTSGDLNSPCTLHGKTAIAGIDVLILERNPQPNEPEVNTYHYILVKTGRDDIPLVLYGPFREGTVIGHWPNSLDVISGYYR
jgi:hypothetical protein